MLTGTIRLTRRMLPYLALALALVLVVACAGTTPVQPAAQATTAPQATTASQATSAPAAGAVALTFYYPVAVPGPITQIIDGYIKKFQAQNPGITVNAVLSGGYGDTLTKIQTTIKGGGAPPDVAVLLSTDLYTLVDGSMITPLDDYINAAGGDAFTNDFYPAFLANSKYQNHIWSLPFQRSTPVLYFNKDAFTAAGLDPNKPPTNYQELVAAAKKLTKPDGSQWGLEISSDGIPYWLFQCFVIGNGGNVVTPGVANKVNFSGPDVVKGLQDFVALPQTEKVMPTGILQWATMPNDFVNGKAAMIYHSSGSLANILKQAKFQVGVAFPVGEKGYGAPTGGGNMYMLKGIPADHQAAAWKFIQFMSSTEIQADWSINTGYIAARQSSYDAQAMKDYLAKTPQAAIGRDYLKYAGAEQATHNNAQVQKFLGDAVQAALTGKSDPTTALNDAQQKADQLLSQFKD